MRTSGLDLATAAGDRVPALSGGSSPCPCTGKHLDASAAADEPATPENQVAQPISTRSDQEGRPPVFVPSVP